MKYTLINSLLFALFSIAVISIGACGGGGGSTKGGETNKVWAWDHPDSLNDNISPDGQNANSPQVAMNNGNAVIVWVQDDNDGNRQIFKSEFRNGIWVHPSSIDDNISPDGTGCNDAHVAMDRNGNTVIIWVQYDGVNSQIFKSEYRNGEWKHPSSTADNISPDGSDCYDPQVAIDDNGNTLIIWEQSDGADMQIFKSEYRSDSWNHPTSLSDNISPDGQDVNSQPQVAMDNSGNAIILWSQSDGAKVQVFKSEYRSSSWNHPTSLSDNISPDGQDAEYARLSMNNGNAIIVWSQRIAALTAMHLFKSEYRNGNWMHPSSLADNFSPDGSPANYPKPAMDNLGNTVIVWYQNDGIYNQIFMSEYRNSTWRHPSSLTDNISPDGQDAESQQTATNDNGNTIIIWDQFDGANWHIVKSEGRNGEWKHPESVTDYISPEGQDSFFPQVVMDNNGNAIIVWCQNDGINDQIFMSEGRFR